MNLTREQVGQLAPDDGSLAAGRKLMALKDWPELGCSAEALWGKCQGSAVYQVKVDLSNLGYHCSCPSRKFPCKHVLGLLLIGAESPQAVSAASAPEWVDEWLQRRRTREEKKVERAAAPAEKKPVDEQAQERRTEKRETRVAEGLDRLDLWLKDLVRTGLAGLETKAPAFWHEQVKRLTDAQAPGLASRVSRLAEVPRSGPDWPERLLGEIGRLKLLTHAWRRIDALDLALQADVRQIIGWTIDQQELDQQGERVEDAWVVAGQWLDEEERVRTQRSWLVGRRTRNTGLVLQFSAGGQPFPESIVPGTEQEATLLFYPGASRQRARMAARSGVVEKLHERIPGAATIAEFLGDVAESLSRQPWLTAFGCVLQDVTLIPASGGRESADCDWFVRDTACAALPLAGRQHWRSLALTGGRPIDVAGEWDGRRLRLLGFVIDGVYRVAT